jgi:AcrR family transcriptional regulator
MTTQYVKAEVRRQQLVAAAREVLRRDGMASTTLRAVASEAGVPLGTVHYIFASKEQLIRAVLEDLMAEIVQAGRATAGDATDMEAALRQTVLGVWGRLVEGDTGQQVMQYELTIWALRTPGMEPIARRQYELYVELMASTLTRAADRAGVTLTRPVDQLARLLLAGIDGLILQFLTLGDAGRARAGLEALVRQIVAAGMRPTTSRQIDLDR